MAPGHVYSMPFKWVSQSRSCLLTQWIEYIFKYANGIFEIIWDTLLLLQISCSKYLHQSRYPRYDVNYLKILLGSLYPNVIQIFALKYTKIFPSLPTWKFISVTFPVHNSWHRGGIWNVSLWIIIKIIIIIISWSWNNVKSISLGTWEDEGDRGPKRFTFPRYFHQSTSIIIIVIKHH